MVHQNAEMVTRKNIIQANLPTNMLLTSFGTGQTNELFDRPVLSVVHSYIFYNMDQYLNYPNFFFSKSLKS